LRIDLHQHPWPASFIDALRARRQPPRVGERTLVLFGGERWDIDPAAHEPARRASGNELICLAPSAAFGIDRLPPDDADELAEAWLVGVLALGSPLRVWGSAGLIEPDQPLARRPRGRVGGLRPSATSISAGERFSFDPSRIYRLVCESACAISIHAYSAPLWRIEQYTVDETGAPHRLSVAHADELRPLEFATA
jgi:hypothetical protein